jgi:hypothetical protein
MFVCFGKAPAAVEFVYDGVEHRNDLRQCSYTALKGLIAFQENADDWRGMQNAYGRALRALEHHAEVGDTGQADEPQPKVSLRTTLLDAEHRLRLLAERTGDYDAEGVAMRINSEADRLGAAATASCVVCHLTLTSDDPHGGLCCAHRYDEQPPCPSCRAGQVVPQQPTCEHGMTEDHSWWGRRCPGPVGQDTTGEQQ